MTDQYITAGQQDHSPFGSVSFVVVLDLEHCWGCMQQPDGPALYLSAALHDKNECTQAFDNFNLHSLPIASSNERISIASNSR